MNIDILIAFLAGAVFGTIGFVCIALIIANSKVDIWDDDDGENLPK